MGIRGEIFSTKVSLENRTYFFNVKENRMGDLYLNIVESKNRDSGGFERQSVILFADDLSDFLKGFDESLKVMEKAVKEKRKASYQKAKQKKEDEDPDKKSRRENSPVALRKRESSRSGKEKTPGDAKKRPRAIKPVRRDPGE